MRGSQGVDGIVRSGDATVVLLLRGGSGGGGGLLGMVLVTRLLVHPGRVGLGAVLVVAVDVGIGHHFLVLEAERWGVEGGGGKRRPDAR